MRNFSRDDEKWKKVLFYAQWNIYGTGHISPSSTYEKNFLTYYRSVHNIDHKYVVKKSKKQRKVLGIKGIKKCKQWGCWGKAPAAENFKKLGCGNMQF